MKWDLIIFDLDGTLINTIGDLGAAVNYSMQEAGFPTHSTEEYKMMVGNGIRNLVKRALPEHLRSDEELCSERLASFVKYYSAHIDELSRPYPGMPELVQSLHDAGIPLAVASNKFQAGTQTLINKFYSGINFCKVLGNCAELPLKPDPKVVELCLEAAGVPNSGRIAMIGDSSVDVRTAQNAGITSIAVTWGFRSEDELRNAGADYIVRSVNELSNLLLHQLG